MNRIRPSLLACGLVFLAYTVSGEPGEPMVPLSLERGPFLVHADASPGGSGALTGYGMSDQRPGSSVPATWANPLISLVIQGLYADFSRSTPFAIPGYTLGPDVVDGEGSPGFQIGETELTVYGAIDPYFYGTAILSFTPQHGAEVEEAFVQTTALPAGFIVKAGKFHSSIGYMNVLHRHADDFVDTPLVYSAFLNGQLADSGVQVRWLAPLDTLVEFGTELLSGDTWPSAGKTDQGRGTKTQYLKVADDLGDSASYLVGFSHLDFAATQRLSGGTGSAHAGGLTFDGTDNLNIASAVYKWSPLGNGKYSGFKFQYEYFEGDEHGVYTTLDNLGSPTQTTIDLRSAQGLTRTGWYAQTVYKFDERWRVGLRQSEVTSSRPRDPNAAGTDLDPLGHTPAISSAMAEFWPTDRSQLRIQYSSDQTLPGEPVHRWYLQYLVALGAHGAHGY